MKFQRTRIKICGLTRPDDVDAAVALGADAIGFVFYPPSPRFVAPGRAAELARRLPPFVTAVGLFVNAARSEVNAVLDSVPLGLLQFHGDETQSDCVSFRVPFIKAARVGPGFDLLEYERNFPKARGLLCDALADGYGGSGQTFDWSLLPDQRSLPMILSGGLNSGNVAEAIRRVRPYAVDVSSGVESTKGIKDAEKMRQFVTAVRATEREDSDS